MENKINDLQKVASHITGYTPHHDFSEGDIAFLALKTYSSQLAFVLLCAQNDLGIVLSRNEGAQVLEFIEEYNAFATFFFKNARECFESLNVES